MTYKDFTLEDLQDRFHVQNRKATLFSKIEPVLPSDALVDFLKEAQSQPIRSEKARSELFVMPVLMELRKRNNRFFNIHSGEYLNIDKQNGLFGECDFLLGKNTGSYSIAAPLISVVEAKKQDFEMGINQCAAQMVGVMKYNISKEKPIPAIYGCVTTGDLWMFLKLDSDNLLQIDTELYSIQQIAVLLGVLQQIVDFYKSIV
jgi:hypothetical protein